jgi:hypothetical protein
MLWVREGELVTVLVEAVGCVLTVEPASVPETAAAQCPKPTTLAPLGPLPKRHLGRGVATMTAWKRILKSRAAVGTGVALGVVLVGGGYAWGSIPDSGNVIHGCYQNSSPHALTLIDTSATPSCPKNTSPLNWNQQGPQGLPGVQGPPGAGALSVFDGSGQNLGKFVSYWPSDHLDLVLNSAGAIWGYNWTDGTIYVPYATAFYYVGPDCTGDAYLQNAGTGDRGLAQDGFTRGNLANASGSPAYVVSGPDQSTSGPLTSEWVDGQGCISLSGPQQTTMFPLAVAGVVPSNAAPHLTLR